MSQRVDGLRLEFSDDAPEVTGLDRINEAVAQYGTRVWPIDVTGTPSEIRDLLRKTVLTDDESARVSDHFLMSRERLLEVLEDAGRRPQVEGGGAMSTYVSNYDYSYPQLYIVNPGVDYSRFDRFHVNVADDGTGTDEFMQVLFGSGVVLHQLLPGGVVTKLHLDCPSDSSGWLATYEGTLPHIGSISGCEPGSKILMQVIGAPRWTMTYLDST